jgi:hypothetical protein
MPRMGACITAALLCGCLLHSAMAAAPRRMLLGETQVCATFILWVLLAHRF